MGSESTVLTLRLEPQVTRQLERLAKATRRSRAFLAAEAIREYLAINEWQIEEIGKALEEADRGEFASDKEVQKTMKKWTRRAR